MSRGILRQSLGQIFAAPAVVAVVSLAGLTGALVGDGIWDLLSSLCLSIPVVLFCACMVRGRQRRTD
jgi:hypothetical protein